MSGVLVDTSVWVTHFRDTEPTLVQLLSLDQALIHPMVLGELACGTPPARAQTLSDLAALQPSQQASAQEVMHFIEKEALFGWGCGWVDMVLLASTLITPGALLWTRDQRLAALSERFGVHYMAPLH